MKPVVVVGVDAGKKGAAAAYNLKTKAIDILDLPLDDERDLEPIAFFNWLSEKEPQLLVIEDCWQPLTLIRMCGEIAAVGKMAGAIVKRVAVCTWKIDMLGVNTNCKELSLKTCRKLQPNVNLKKPKARTDSPDRAEAVLLALYAEKIFKNEIDNR